MQRSVNGLGSSEMHLKLRLGQCWLAGSSGFCARTTRCISADASLLSCTFLLCWAHCFPQTLILCKFFSGKICGGEAKKFQETANLGCRLCCDALGSAGWYLWKPDKYPRVYLWPWSSLATAAALKKKFKIAILGRTEGQKYPCWLDVKVGLEIESSAPLKVKPGGM